MDFERLDIAQRKMLRQIVNFSKRGDETWEEANHRIKQRREKAMELVGSSKWSADLLKCKLKLKSRILHGNNPLLSEVFAWDPSKCKDEKLMV